MREWETHSLINILISDSANMFPSFQSLLLCHKHLLSIHTYMRRFHTRNLKEAYLLFRRNHMLNQLQYKLL